MVTSDSEIGVIDLDLAKVITDAGGEMDSTHGEFVGTYRRADIGKFQTTRLSGSR